MICLEDDNMPDGAKNPLFFAGDFHCEEKF